MKFYNINKKTGLRYLFAVMLIKAAVICSSLFLSHFSMAAEQSESIWDEDLEITCDNIVQVFTEYNNTISVIGQASIDSLKDMGNFLNNSSDEIEPLRQKTAKEVSNTLTRVGIQNTTVGDMGTAILDNLEDCLQKK